jgi:hypothetical protein
VLAPAAADAVEGQIVAVGPAGLTAVADLVPSVVGRTIENLDRLAPGHDRDDVGPGAGCVAEIERIGANLRRGRGADTTRQTDARGDDDRRQHHDGGKDAKRSRRRAAVSSRAADRLGRCVCVGIGVRRFQPPLPRVHSLIHRRCPPHRFLCSWFRVPARRERSVPLVRRGSGSGKPMVGGRT